MKHLLTKLLLALSLVLNPVTVFAGDLHDVNIQAKETAKETPCDAAMQQTNLNLPSQHDNTNCDMPCCEDSVCTMQDICVVHHSLVFLTQNGMRFNHPNEYSGWDTFIVSVPDRELPPENPPPILL